MTVKLALVLFVLCAIVFSVPALRRRFLGRWAAVLLAGLWVGALIAVLVR